MSWLRTKMSLGSEDSTTHHMLSKGFSVSCLAALETVLQIRHEHYVSSTVPSCKSCQRVVRQENGKVPESHRARGERQAKRWCPRS